MKVPEFLQHLHHNKHHHSSSSSSSSSSSTQDIMLNQRTPYSKLEAFKDELDQPLQPHIDQLPPSKCSTVQAFGNTIKSFVGVGMLALPYGMKQSGLWAGIIGLIIIGFASAYTMKSLIRCKIEMELRRKFVSETNNQPSTPRDSVSDDSEISYGYIGKHIFGRPGLILVNFAIISSQLGFCCAYILFIGHNLNILWDNLEVRVYAVMFLPLYILLSWIRNMKFLAPISIFANLALAFAVGVVFYYGFSHVKLKHSYTFIHFDTFPLFFGIAVFGFEGINLAIPIQNSMQNPRAYPRMLNLSLICVGVLYILFGTLGFLFFGEDTHAIITKNLPANTPVVIIVQLCLIFELALSYPVQLFPVTLIVESGLEKYLQKHRVIKQNILRTAIVAITVGVSVGVPYFDSLTSLIGSFSNSMVVFIFPSLFLLAIFRGRLTWPEVVLNVAILVLGIIASAISSAISIIDIIQKIQGDTDDSSNSTTYG